MSILIVLETVVNDIFVFKHNCDIVVIGCCCNSLNIGFIGTDKDYKSSTVLLPYKKPRRSKKNPDPKLTDEQIAANKVHSKNRVVVEHSIGGMKQFFCLTHRVCAQSRNVVNKFVLLYAGLFNHKISAKLTY